MNYSVTSLKTPSQSEIDELIAIVGAGNAVTDPDHQERYLTEWRDRYHGTSPLIIKPGSTEEVAAILKYANEHRLGIVPQGGNTGLVGGQIPRVEAHDIVLSVERLKSLREINSGSGYAIAEAGMTLAELQCHAHDAGMMFPLRMASEGSATIAGALATNAGGVHVLAYGAMRAQTLGLEAVFANGDVWHGLRTLKKDNTGYDLKDLIIGSEGTLAVITAAALKLSPYPASSANAMIGLETLEDVKELFIRLSASLGSELTAFEFMSAQAMRFAGEFVGDTSPMLTNPAPWTILIEVSSHQSGDDADKKLTSALVDEEISSRIKTSAVAANSKQSQTFWSWRESISEAQKIAGGSIKHDISVPIEKIPAFIAKANHIVTALCPGARPCPFGHFGDGNIHYNVSQPADADKAAFLAHWEDMQTAVHELVIKVGGSISAEHGIGVMKRKELRKMKSTVELDMMRAVKQALDPNGILNPGKLL